MIISNNNTTCERDSVEKLNSYITGKNILITFGKKTIAEKRCERKKKYNLYIEQEERTGHAGLECNQR